MELVSIIIKNYKIHKEINIDFKSGLNLLIGNNETGKSTIVDAIHRALFFQVKGNTEEHKLLKSFTGGLNPEVQLKFIHSGEEYVLTKIFGTDKITLNSPKISKTGDDAESELGKILNEPTGVKGSAYSGRWQHLWIWQGKSGEDVLKTVNEKQQHLFQNLQNNGPAMLILSELDKTIASSIQDDVSKMQTEKGQYKTSSDYFKLKEKKDTFVIKEAEAKEKYEKLLSSAEKLDEIELELETSVDNGKQFEDRLNELKKDLETIKELKGSKVLSIEKRRTAEKDLEDFENDCNLLNSYTKKKLTIQALIDPINSEVSEIEKKIVEQKIDLAQNKTALNQAEDDLVLANRKANYYRKVKECAVKNESLQNKRGLQTRVSVLKTDLLKVNSEFTTLPEISDDDYKSLALLEKKISESTAVLDSISTGIEILEVKGNITLSGKQVKKGHQETITTESIIELENGTQIKIKPGGSHELESKSQVLKNLNIEKDELYNKLRANSLEHAYEILVNRKYLANQAAQIKERIADLNASTIELDIQTLELEITRMTGEANADAELLGLPLSDNFDDLQKISDEMSAVEIILKSKEESVSELKSKAEYLSRTLEDLEGKLKLTTEKLQIQKDELLSAVTLEKNKISQLGDVNTRAEKLLVLQNSFNSLNSELEQIDKELIELNFEETENESERFLRSLQNVKNRINELTKSQVQLETELRQDGGRDFQDEYTAAIAQREEAERMFDSVRKRSEAMILLDRLFQGEQQKITDAYMTQFKDKISKYLQIIFGKDVEAQIEVAGTSFSKLALYRDHQGIKQSMSFDSLSGGAKEQFSNAVRLAMAEVLAESYDGKLPIVLDESFNNTDPSRMMRVHKMLDLAAKNGLQLIIISSDPKDYLSLGANEFRLSI